MAKPPPDPLLNDVKRVGERLRDARNAMELTQIALAEKSGVSRSAIVHYEQGNAPPGGNELIKLAATLRITPNFILSGSDDFFRSESVDQVLANAPPEEIVPRLAMCFAVLDREMQEALSALLMTMAKAKLGKRGFKEFSKAITSIAQLAPKMEKGVEKVATKLLDESGLLKQDAKPKRQAKSK
jgi:transcriptional regulator with XRE-family HTH domain